MKDTDWHIYVSFVPLCYNTSTHTTTGFTPAKAFLGWEPRLPCDLFTGDLKAYQEDLSGSDYVSEMEIQIKTIQALINSKWELEGEKYVNKTNMVLKFYHLKKEI